MSENPPTGSFLFGDSRIKIEGKFYAVQDIAITNGKFGTVDDGKTHPMRIQFTVVETSWRKPKHAILALSLSPEHAKQIFDGINELILDNLNEESTVPQSPTKKEK
jgi:hypothetical protein